MKDTSRNSGDKETIELTSTAKDAVYVTNRIAGKDIQFLMDTGAQGDAN